MARKTRRSPLIFSTLIRCAHPCSNCTVIFSTVYCLHSGTPFKCAARPAAKLANSSASSPEDCFPSYRLCNRSEPRSFVWLPFPALADQSSGKGHCQRRAAMLPSATLGTWVITSRHQRHLLTVSFPKNGTQ